MANFLVLFDIDGTLLFKQNVHADAFLYAFRTVYGVPDPVWRPHHGETDLLIIDIELGQLGFTQEEIDARLPECLDTMVKYMREHVHEDQGYMIDYVPEFLAAVRELGYFQGLVTGNLEDIAYVKMEHYGLVEFFEDHIGGFGNEHRDRGARSRSLQSGPRRIPQVRSVPSSRKQCLRDCPLQVLGSTRARGPPRGTREHSQSCTPGLRARAPACTSPWCRGTRASGRRFLLG